MKSSSIHKNMATEWKGKYLGFVKRNDGIVEVWNKSDEFLGIIFYYNKWKSFCFIPYKDTFFSQGCIKTILDYMKIDIQDWKKLKKFNQIPECSSPANNLLNTLGKE